LKNKVAWFTERSVASRLCEMLVKDAQHVVPSHLVSDMELRVHVA